MTPREVQVGYAYVAVLGFVFLSGTDAKIQTRKGDTVEVYDLFPQDERGHAFIVRYYPQESSAALKTNVYHDLAAFQVALASIVGR